jgi:agmatine deiminase
MSEKLISDPRFTYSCIALNNLLGKHSIKYQFLKATKDIWCRDYMPIQLDHGKYVQFSYQPSYLSDNIDLQTDPREVCKVNDINPINSKINLDGGNVVNWSDRAIISDRVFDENPNYTSKSKLISELEQLLEVEIIIIPQIFSDMTGHTDGMVRFIDRTTLLGNDRTTEYQYWSKGVNAILKEKGIDYIDVPHFEHKDKNHPYNAIGCYINYLEVGNLIVMPIFETYNNKDKEAYDVFKRVYPDRVIETINFNEIGRYGGLLNCSTWTTLD